MALDFTAKTVWNMDEARMRVLNQYMVLCEIAFYDWDLNSIHNSLISIRRAISGMLKETDYNKMGKIFQKLEQIKREMNMEKEDEYHILKVKFYNICDELYVELNRAMKKHGLFFREGDDPTRAALKR